MLWRRRTRASPPGGTRKHPAGPLRVVLADDVEAMRVLLRTALEPECTIVGEAADGAEAITLCQRHTPDAVLVDLNMPHVDGLEAIRAIRAESPDTTIIVLSGLPGDVIADKALALGAHRYIDKAAPLHELRETLTAAVAR